MKTFVILTAASLALVGCGQPTNQMNEPAGAQNQTEQQQESIDQKQSQVEDSAEQTKDQIESRSEAQKEKIEAQAEAKKAQLEAKKQSLQAQTQAQQAQEKNQPGAPQLNGINESAGASNLAKQVHDSLASQNASLAGVNITEADGTVTLSGSVATEAEKQNLEAQAKAVQGVKSVDNKLEVK